MSDLIDREDAIKDAESWVAVDEYEKHLQKNVVEWLKEFPPAELGTNLASLGTDCISRQAAIDAVGAALLSWSNMPEWRDNKIIEAVEQLPPIQPKRGRWIGKYPVTSVCSECGFLIHDSKVKAFAYCPNCGADMRGDSDE